MSRKHEHEDDDERGSRGAVTFLTGLLLGAAAGAGVALLFAPHSGARTRRIIRRRARALQREAGDRLDAVREETREAFQEKKDSLRRRLERGIERAEESLGA